ncbi:hypothetical protein GCM10025857_26030 [Alicyclobacillus contaminans]|uniref:type 1 glutamine amidotransferase domain-containing protein n=1 Tax=Alicyclobacillus contaminans TaxID=392016 RepID=UPI00041BF6AD|nr:type 1 glutamine amidotransferase domain-containing protein [Alicyclobacillus contaminans]GMA51246.1 hypothetical protein GCM10025857_26030 [Alicyclobacillus contaminans]
MTQKAVLMVVTSADKIDDTLRTGLWLSEFAEPYTEFVAQGYRVTVASIKGGSAPIDPRSLDNETEKRWPDAIAVLKDTVPITQVRAEDFDAIFLPGGHGTMFDLPTNPELQSLIRQFAETGKVIAAVCHGPAGLVGVTLTNGEPLVKGKRVTSFTNDEERAVQLDDKVPFLLEDRLRELGAAFIGQPLWSDHVVQDGNLITGQNPQSGISTAKAVIKALS